MSVEKPSSIEVSNKDVSKQQLDFALREFNSSVVRGYSLSLISEEVRKEYIKMEKIPEEELKRSQGKIAALHWLHSILENNFQHQKAN